MFSLAWLRGNCPCATCREERRAAAENTDPLRLVSTPPPSTAVAAAEFVGHYAIRLTWDDGHATGIYPVHRAARLLPVFCVQPGRPAAAGLRLRSVTPTTW
jgi:DUF971 family protein